MFSQKIVLLLAFVYISSARAKSLQDGSVTTCEISPETAETGESVTVTCHFPYDVDQLTSFSASIGYFPTSEPGRKYEVKLAECTKINTPEKACFMYGDVYTLEAIKKKNLNLTITNISPQHSGRFLCQMMPQEDEGDIPKSQMCSLTVDGVAPVPRTTAAAAEASTGVEGVMPVPRTTVAAAVSSTGVEGVPTMEPISAGRDVKEETNVALIIVPIVVVVVLAVVAVIVVILYRRREMQNRSGGRREASVEETDDTIDPDRTQSVRGQDGLVAQRCEQFGGQGGTASNDLASGRTDAGGGGETTCTDDETTNRRADDGNTEIDDKHGDEAEKPLLPAKRPDREREMQNRSGGRREASVEETDDTIDPDRIRSVRGQDGLVAQRREQFGGQGGTASNDLASGRTDAGGGGETTCTDDETTNGRADEGNTEIDDKHGDEAEEPLLPAKGRTGAEGGGEITSTNGETTNRDDGNAEGDDKHDDKEEEDAKKPLLPDKRAEGGGAMAEGDDKGNDEVDRDEKSPLLPPITTEGVREMAGGDDETNKGKADDGTVQKDDKHDDEAEEEDLPRGIQEECGDEQGDKEGRDVGPPFREYYGRYVSRANPKDHQGSPMVPGESPSKD